MKLNPLGARVVVRREVAKTTASGIVLPDNVRDRPRLGVVLAVGPGILLQDGSYSLLRVKKGDRVLLKPNGGFPFGREGEGLLLVDISEVLGVVEEE